MQLFSTARAVSTVNFLLCCGVYRQAVFCLLKFQAFSSTKSGVVLLNSNDFLIETLSKGICVEGGDFLAKLYLLRCNLSGYMQANRTVCFFKLTQFFYTYQQNRYTLQFCFFVLFVVCRWLLSLSVSAICFLYRQTSS